MTLGWKRTFMWGGHTKHYYCIKTKQYNRIQT